MATEIKERDQQAQVMMAVSQEVDKATPTMEHYKVLESEPTGLMDDDGGIMLDIDGEDLLFSDDTFPSLPDFSCLSSPPATPSAASTNMHAKKALLSSTSSASSSSSSASWSFLHVPDSGAVDMQQHEQPVALPSAIDEIMMLAQPSLSSTSDHNHQNGAGDGGEFSEVGLDILGDIDLFDVTADPWDPCSIFPGEEINIDAAAVDEGDAGKRGNFPGEGRLNSGFDGEGLEDKVQAVQQQQQEEEVEENNSSEDLAKVFLDWLKNNKDMISPEDLRSIKLKRSTIECAARRLGGGKQGRMQLLKLILTWVQANHLHGKRRRGRPATPGEAAAPLSYLYQQQQQFPVNPNLNHFEYNYGGAAAGVETSSNNLAPRCNSWIPYSMDPSNGSMMTAYGGGSGGGEMMYQTAAAAAAPYPYHCSSNSVMVKPQQFSSASPDFHSPDHGVGAWPSQFAAPAPSFAPFSGSCPAPMAMAPPPYPGAFPNQFPGAHPMYNQGQRLAGMASATKEARKKRMARQRRFSSLHHQRSQNQHQLPQAHQPGGPAVATSAAAGSPVAANPRNWAFWTNMSPSSSHQMNPMANAAPPPLPPTALHHQQQQPQQPQHLQQHNTQKNAAASASNLEKRQGWKSSEKNLKFLLQKVLKQSDVGSLGRIVLPKKEAEIHLPELDARDGISIQMEDIGTSRVWNMRYRYWPNNKSRMYLLENTGDFVRSNGLQEGDFIVIYSDMKCGKYMIRGVKVHQQMEARRAATTSRNAGRAQKKRCCSERTDDSGFRENEGVDDEEDEEYEDATPSSMGKMDHSP